MEPFTQLSGIAVPLPIDNLDTDQLMPKQFLRSIDKSGLARGLLFNMRCASDGTPKPDSVFNRPGFEHIQIIAAQLRLRIQPRACCLGPPSIRHSGGNCALFW